MRMIRILFFFTLCAALCAPSTILAQATTGSVSGRVLDADGKIPLSGASVRIKGTLLVTTTDFSGAFRLAPVPIGSQKLEVSSLGYMVSEFDVEVAAGGTSGLEIVMVPEQRYTESVTVTAAPMLQQQERALNQQKNAINIKNIVSADQIGRFPDPNSAEATQRISGVTLQRDQGEGRFILVRGTEPRLSSAAINGEQLAAPESNVRFVALDVIPADLLESIEVTKAITPDMDGDSIGGAVNLVTKQATAGMRGSWTLGLGYNDIVSDSLQNVNGSFAQRSADGKTGVVLSGSYHNTNRGSENFEAEYDDGELDEFQLRHYTINRKRYGVQGALDRAFGESSRFYVKGIFNQYDDDEQRRRRVDVIGDGEMERELKDRFESQRIISISTGADHGLGSLMRFDWEFAYSYAREEEPDRVDTNFIQEGLEFNPNVSASSIDPNNIQTNPSGENVNEFLFDELTNEDNLTEDRILSASLNLSQPFASGLWKVGSKFKFRDKERDNNSFVYESDNDLFLANSLDPDFDSGIIIDGRYNMGNAFVAPDAARGLIGQLDGEKDLEEDLADYNGTENTYAAFGMVELMAGEKATVLAGARYEYVDLDFTSGELILDEEGEIASITPIQGTNDYNYFLPMFHLRYAIGPDSNLRAAVTRSYARPNFVSFIPTTTINQEDREIERGNPDLLPTTSWNLDFLGEHYFSSTVGVVSGGFFLKNLNNYIYTTRTEIEREGRTFEVTEPQNFEGGRLYGVEVAYQNPLRFLPSPLDGLGVFFNWTFSSSRSELPERQDLNDRLPGQADSLGNFTLAYEKYGFSGHVSFNYHEDYLFEVGESPVEDTFIDNHFQIDISLSQKIARQWRLFADFINVNNEPWRLYIGSPDRPIQEEYYSWWGTFGVKWDF